jgi:aspartyl/asparaginyl-tRNA synthetase
MGDRFYMQQKLHKPKRVLKKDVIAELDEVLGGTRIEGMDRLTIKTLRELIIAIRWLHDTN